MLKHINQPMKIFTVAVMLFAIANSVSAQTAITIYNNNLALVNEVRKLDFEKGIADIRFQDIPSGIIPSSVYFESKNASLLEQNYEYDLIDFSKLLNRFIDLSVTVTTKDNRIFIGKLLSSVDGILIQQTNNELINIKNDWVADVAFAQIPDGLITRPTLVWKVNSNNSGKHDARVSYLTNGVSWEAEYVTLINDKETSMNVNGWVNITNNSGGTFKDTKIKLIAGDVNMVRSSRPMYDKVRTMAMSAEGSSQFEEQAFYEYHLYTMQRNSDLLNNQNKQIALFNKASVKKVDKEYRFGPSVKQPYNGHEKVKVTLSFENSKPNELGIPLPKGRIRVYKEGPDGSAEFIGEDRIDHTPQGEMVFISTGNAFDVVGERLVKDVAGRGQERTIEFKLRNRKNEAITMIVSDSIHGHWDMLQATEGWKKESANIIEWKVDLKPNEEKIITYRYLQR